MEPQINADKFKNKFGRFGVAAFVDPTGESA